MRAAATTRTAVLAALCCVVGLLAARLPSMGQEAAQFSWVAFVVGASLVLVAFVLSRPLVRSGLASPQGSRLQRVSLQSAVVLFLAALVLFTLVVYTGWLVAKVLLVLAVVGAVACVLLAFIATTLSGRNDG